MKDQLNGLKKPTLTELGDIVYRQSDMHLISSLISDYKSSHLITTISGFACTRDTFAHSFYHKSQTLLNFDMCSIGIFPIRKQRDPVSQKTLKALHK